MATRVPLSVMTSMGLVATDTTFAAVQAIMPSSDPMPMPMPQNAAASPVASLLVQRRDVAYRSTKPQPVGSDPSSSGRRARCRPAMTGSPAGKTTCRGAGLQVGLERMRALLKRVPAALRRQVLAEKVTQELRHALLRYMEANPEPPSAAVTAAGDKQRCSRAASKSAALTSKRRGYRSTGAVSRLGSQYYARMTIDGIAISSRCVASEREAKRLKALLVRVHERLPRDRLARATCLKACFGPAPTATMLEAESAEVELQEVIEEAWSFGVVISTRSLTGGCFSSQRVQDISQAMELRERLLVARADGWETFRAAIADCLSGRCLSRRHGGGTATTVAAAAADSARLPAELRLRRLDAQHAAAAAAAEGRRHQRRRDGEAAAAMVLHPAEAGKAMRRVEKLILQLEHAIASSKKQASDPTARRLQPVRRGPWQEPAKKRPCLGGQLLTIRTECASRRDRILTRNLLTS
eukprot:TRINITY_DN3758_c0_g4_i1.p1 TRINITY_DN3758_c0_g4~~TRINITY_DN3758_c0_g4_i1.p1  ORF type:complete len:468 (+),score=97.75 TRINITY_DN3758_c0_g4_i1:31-1434(+)